MRKSRREQIGEEKSQKALFLGEFQLVLVLVGFGFCFWVWPGPRIQRKKRLCLPRDKLANHFAQAEGPEQNTAPRILEVACLGSGIRNHHCCRCPFAGYVESLLLFFVTVSEAPGWAFLR